MFGWKLVKEETKAKTEGKAVDENGNEVKVDVVDNETGKPIRTWKDHLKTAGKVILGVGVTLGAGFAGAKVGGDKVRKAKDAEIRKLQDDNWNLSQELESAYVKAEPEDEEPEITTEEVDGVTVGHF